MVTRVPTRMITTTGVQAGSYTAADITVNEAGQITSAASNSIVASGGGGPKITGVVVTDNAWTALDDTAVDVLGGYIKITGTGFSSGCQVVVGTLVATSVSFVSSTEVRAQVPAQTAGTYTVYLTNSDGGVAIRVNGLNYSSTPTWTTTSPLPGGAKDAAISIQLAASSNSTIAYSLASGSTLPSGLTLSGSGLLSGTVTGITVETTYNFTVVATDQENQDTPQAFQITITVNDPYYRLVTLHLPGTGTNLAANNTFLDGSTNNFTITRNGNTTQGTFSPFSQTGWGNYFSTSSAGYFYVPDSTPLNLSGSAYTIEGWINPEGSYTTSGSYSGYNTIISKRVTGGSSSSAWEVFLNITTGALSFYNGTAYTGSTTPTAGQWNHFAAVYDGTNLSLYLNGNRVLAPTAVTNTNYSANIVIGSYDAGSGSFEQFRGYISNLRVTKGTALYSGTTYTVPTSALTTTVSSGTVSLLTCQNNRFVDNANNATVTVSGSPRVVAFSPFNPTASWSAATYGGSGYFDGTGDSLSLPANWNGVTFGTGAFSFEVWMYPLATNTDARVLGANNFASDARMFFSNYGSTGFGIATGSAWQLFTSTPPPLYQWTHIVVCRSGGTLSIFFNGVRQATSTNNNSLGLDTSYSIGGGNWYLSNLRIVKNSTAYDPTQTTLTIPTAPTTAIANTSLLFNFTNAGILDATSKNDLETVGNAQISTTQSKWGGSSMSFDGTGDYLVGPSNSLFNFGSSDFTMEGWFNQTGLSNSYPGIMSNPITFSAGAWSVLGSHASTGVRKLQFYCYNYSASAPLLLGTTTLSDNTWYYFAVTRSGSTFRLFLNGTIEATTTFAGSMTSADNGIAIGTNQVTSGFPFQGYLQDIRVTRGYARYTANFTPPTQAFQTF